MTTRDGKFNFAGLLAIAVAVLIVGLLGVSGGIDPLVAQGVTNFDQLALSAGATTSILEVNQTSTGNVVDFQDGGSSVFTVADGGGVTLTGALVGTTVDVNGTADAIIVDADGDTTISAPTDDQIDIEVSAADEYVITSTYFDFNANELTLDADNDTSITADTDDQIDIEVSGTDVGQWTPSGLVKGSYFTVSFEAADTVLTATQDPIFTWQMPFAATLIECSGVVRVVDTGSGNETYAFALEDDGSAITSAWAVTASNTADLCTVDTAAVADNSVMEVTLTLGGTTPSAEDAYVVFTFQR